MVLLALVLLIFTTPLVTLVVVLVLAPEIVVKPAPEVMGVKLKVPTPKLETVPGSRILPLPAFRVLLAPRITPVVESPRVMRVLVVATMPLIETEEGVVTLRPSVKVNVSPPLPNVTAPVLRKSTSATKVLPVPVMLTVVAVVAVIKSLTVTASVNAADAPLVMVRSLIATVVPVMAPPVPAFKPKLKELILSVMPAPKAMFAPAVEPPLVLPTFEAAVSVTPPVPKLITSPELVMAAPTLDVALPVKFKPPSNANVAPPTLLPRVTAPVLRKSTLATKEPEDVMLTVVAVAAVIKSLTATAPNAADAPLVMVRLLIDAIVPVMAPPVPAFKPKSKELGPSVMSAPKMMFAPAAEPPAFVVSTVELAVNRTPPMLKLITSPELVMAAPTLDVALPVKFKPPTNANVSAVALPRVTRPLLRKSTSATKVLPVPVMEMVVAVAVVIKSLTVTALVNAADAPLVIVRLLIATVAPVMAPPVPAFKPKLKAAPLMLAPKVMFAPAVEPPPVLPTVEAAVIVTPPVPKLITSPELVMAAPTLDVELPVKFKPPSNANVSPPLPKVTRPLLRKFTLATKVLPEPVMLTVVAVAAVIKSLTVTAPVNAADAPLVMVRLLMLTDVPEMAPPVPAFKPKFKAAPLMPALKVMFAPAAEPPAFVVSMVEAAVFKVTVLLNITASPDVVIFTPSMVAALTTVNALLNKELAVLKVTPVPPAVNVVIPVMVPPPETLSTVIVPAPAAVMFKEPAAVMKSSSRLLRFNPPNALPKNTFVPELLVIPIAPATFIAAPIETSPALLIVSAESCAEFPTVPVKVIVPAPAVRPRVCAPLSVLLNRMLLLVVLRATLAPRVTAPV